MDHSMAVLISVYFIGLIGFFIHLFSLQKKERTFPRVIEFLLLYQIVFSLGITSLLAFIGFSFMPDEVASFLGWNSCPFQQELANVNLAFGVLGIMSIWYRDDFWTATIIGFSIWIFADGLHHLYEYFWYGNNTAGNIGVPLYTDLIIPTILLVLLVLYKMVVKK
jgi:hypothetical protein